MLESPESAACGGVYRNSPTFTALAKKIAIVLSFVAKKQYSAATEYWPQTLNILNKSCETLDLKDKQLLDEVVLITGESMLSAELLPIEMLRRWIELCPKGIHKR